MKNCVCIVLIVMVLFLASCQEGQQQSQPQQVESESQLHPQAQIQNPYPQSQTSDIHTAVVQEVIQTTSYTYLNVSEDNSTYWIAVRKMDASPSETVSFPTGMKMENFTSRELERTFDAVYFIGAIKKDSSDAETTSTQNPHQKPAVEKLDVSVDAPEGGITIAQLFSSPADYANTVVRIRGQVTKVNLDIMGRNWIHLQDGTGQAGQYDLIVTTQDTVAEGDIVVAEGTISKDKDFGYGYFYELLMEDAKLTN